MPLYDYTCDNCGELLEAHLPMSHERPVCCEADMRRLYSVDMIILKEKYPLWVDRMDDVHKAQEQRGEKLRFVHPSEIL